MTRKRTTVFIWILIATLALAACNLSRQETYIEPIYQAQTASATPRRATTATETIPPYTPLATLTPSQTLRPPPTFEAATATVPASLTPTVTLTATIDLSISIPGLRGAESPTPSSTAGCVLRKDWKLRYTVQREDALARIAQKYNTSVQELAAANCLTDVNVITIGQELRVPGSQQPYEPAIPCVPWELLTPMDGTLNVLGTGNLTFDWHGPRAPRNLIRVIRPGGALYEKVIELRQNETIDLKDLPEEGTFTWYVYPLDQNFVQIPCKEGGPWTFSKAAAPTSTPTFTPAAKIP